MYCWALSFWLRATSHYDPRDEQHLLYQSHIRVVMFGDYYVCISYKESASPASADKLVELSEQYDRKGFGDPRLGFLETSGDVAFVFEGLNHASSFAKDALSLDDILEVRMGSL